MNSLEATFFYLVINFIYKLYALIEKKELFSTKNKYCAEIKFIC